MPFRSVRGQPTAVETLSRALQSGQVHHAYRFEGPDGVGKELCAFAFAQALLCRAGDPLGCGTCESCRRVVARTGDGSDLPLHPDVVLVGRGVYRPEVIGRSSPEVAEISVQQIRKVVLSRASYAPHEGPAQVFVIRGADELSISAANGLLKTLEEPRPGTHFVLLTARPDRLLSTIRSRTLAVRFGPLPDDVVRGILAEQGADAADLDALVELAAGSAAAALGALDPEQSEARRRFVAAVTEAVAAADLGPAVAFSESVATDRRILRGELLALAAHYAGFARQSVAQAPAEAELAAVRHDLVLAAVDALERNASNNLTMSTLVLQLRRAC
ncbi:MAG: DNA polymerase III subunit delta' [Deltaproteobacteria bacterium]|nr:DNA polymerase III subunit delta' [Deltaproteobacteria bacterium]MBW2535585.1 DNA polymerase III subunit delta' [Deltaproteobacteria bacterium]